MVRRLVVFHELFDQIQHVVNFLLTLEQRSHFVRHLRANHGFTSQHCFHRNVDRPRPHNSTLDTDSARQTDRLSTQLTAARGIATRETQQQKDSSETETDQTSGHHSGTNTCQNKRDSHAQD
uniref:(northern house mosquito) hypothetical protein n=1 Tax=Culex pipiens TaxID=7175 RepID=A0A8D8K4J1_CULPI